MDLEVQEFEGYELLDSGDGRKLERFGDILLDRPAAQAIWPLDKNAPWKNARATFIRGTGGNGEWEFKGKKPPEGWTLKWNDLLLEIRLTGFGNVGLFPEHISHWQWMADMIGTRKNIQILNLFAYSGGASLVCAKAGAKVTHVDAAKAVNNWCNKNITLNKIDGSQIRLITDDALKFVQREQRREKKYDAIILDPPTFGRGAKSEVWKIEKDFYKLLKACQSILTKDPMFILASSHSPGVSPSVLRSMLTSILKGKVQDGEMLLKGKGPILPAGVYARWSV